jgi:radical SAM protein with 4Fe4S-binding SPASM domain
VTVCTNAVSVTEALIETARQLGHVSFNVSVDGTTAESHGRFRGRRDSFAETLDGVRRLGDAGLLKGVLSTPNSLADPAEYDGVFDLAEEAGADYLLMNPLSSFGRGIRTRGRLKADEQTMSGIAATISAKAEDSTTDAVFIRFPNDTRPLGGCIAGDLFYVFATGEVAVCPYLVFATENPGAQHRREEFIVGNLFTDADIAERLDAYKFHERYSVGSNPSCGGCSAYGTCGKGCPAAVIAAGGSIGDVDVDLCPSPANVQCS